MREIWVAVGSGLQSVHCIRHEGQLLYNFMSKLGPVTLQDQAVDPPSSAALPDSCCPWNNLSAGRSAAATEWVVEGS